MDAEDTPNPGAAHAADGNHAAVKFGLIGPDPNPRRRPICVSAAGARSAMPASGAAVAVECAAHGEAAAATLPRATVAVEDQKVTDRRV